MHTVISKSTFENVAATLFATLSGVATLVVVMFVSVHFVQDFELGVLTTLFPAILGIVVGLGLVGWQVDGFTDRISLGPWAVITACVVSVSALVIYPITEMYITTDLAALATWTAVAFGYFSFTFAYCLCAWGVEWMS